MNSNQKANNTFVNFFSDESLSVIKDTLKTSVNFTNEFNFFMKESNDEQKSNLLNFIFSPPVPPIDIHKIRNMLITFETMKVPELQAFCKKHNLKTKGSKYDLIQNIQLSLVNFEQFGSNFIEDFNNWAKLFVVGWENEIDVEQDETLLNFITRITKNKKFIFKNVLREQNELALFKYFEPKQVILNWILFNYQPKRITAKTVEQNPTGVLDIIMNDPELKKEFMDLLDNSLNAKTFLKWKKDEITIINQTINNFKPRKNEGLLKFLIRIVDFVNYFEQGQDDRILKYKNQTYTPREMIKYYGDETTINRRR